MKQSQDLLFSCLLHKQEILEVKGVSAGRFPPWREKQALCCKGKQHTLTFARDVKGIWGNYLLSCQKLDEKIYTALMVVWYEAG